jgi:fatty-acyl-CoA synthase
MLSMLKQLYRARLISPFGLFHLLSAGLRSGMNVMALLRFAAKLFPRRTAVTDANEQLTYTTLLAQTEQLSRALQNNYNVTRGRKVAIMCRNHAALVRSIFAVSRCGADLYLLNVEMNSNQFATLAGRYQFDLIIHDAEVAAMITGYSSTLKKIPAYDLVIPSIDSISRSASMSTEKLRATRSGKIIVLTGGTTGDFKTAERQPVPVNFLSPFLTLLGKLELNLYRTVYIATPIYHGFGIASLFMSIILGKEIFLSQKFDTKKAADLIQQNSIEVIILVPLMLSRLLKQATAVTRSLKCIISGGAALSPVLVTEAINEYGCNLFNLYGTSEAGFSILANPADLRYNPNTLGKEIGGVQLKILDAENLPLPAGAIGRICINSSWTIQKNADSWIETGDLGYRDSKGYIFLCGKVDDMIVSGGENVYPIELENILVQHQEIRQAAVIGINDEEFGQRLKAFIVPSVDSALNKEDVLLWLSTRAARYQMPKQIEFLEDIPHTALGKPDKKMLN